MKHKIFLIDEKSSYLEEVIKLGKENSATLGFFPKGAFLEYAVKKSIIVVTVDNEFAGYLLFRISKNSVTIVHLCIKENFQGKKLTRKLVDYLKQESTFFKGVLLTKLFPVSLSLKSRHLVF